MPRDPFTIRGITRRLPSMLDVTVGYTKEPYIGLTQGGSSRPNGPAIIAARKSRAPGNGNAIASAVATTPEEDPTDV